MDSIGYTIDVNLARIQMGRAAWKENKSSVKGSRLWWYHLPLLRGHVVRGPGGSSPGPGKRQRVEPVQPSYMDLVLNTTTTQVVEITRARLRASLEGALKNVP